MKLLVAILYGAIFYYTFVTFPPGLAVLISVVVALIAAFVYLGIDILEKSNVD